MSETVNEEVAVAAEITLEEVSGETPQDSEVVGEKIITYDDSPSDETIALLEEMNVDDPVVVAEAAAKVPEVKEEVKEPEPEPKEDARFSKAFTELSRKEKDLASREADLKTVSSSLEQLSVAAGKFKDQPVDFIKAQIRAFAKSDDPEVVDSAFRDLYESMTMHVLGADAPEEMQEQSRYNKLQREWDSYKREQEDKQHNLEAKALNAERTGKVEAAKSNIRAELNTKATNFPYLMGQKEAEVGEVVYEAVWQDYNNKLNAGEKDPTPMSVEEASTLLNSHYQDIAQRWASLVPQAKQTPRPQTSAQPANIVPGGQVSLTNNSASIAPTSESSGYIEDDEESKEALMKLLQL